MEQGSSSQSQERKRKGRPGEYNEDGSLVWPMNTQLAPATSNDFNPSEDELIEQYLNKKVAAEITDINLQVIDLGEKEPWNIPTACELGYGEKSQWYFFSRIKKKSIGSSSTSRTTGAGYWKVNGQDKDIYNKSGKLVGIRKSLSFYLGKSSERKNTEWILYEYRNQNEQSWVVCKLFKKTKRIKVGEHKQPARVELGPVQEIIDDLEAQLEEPIDLDKSYTEVEEKWMTKFVSSVMPTAGASTSNVMPMAGASTSNVMPMAGASTSTVTPKAAASMSTVMPTAGASISTVMPTAGASTSTAGPISDLPSSSFFHGDN